MNLNDGTVEGLEAPRAADLRRAVPSRGRARAARRAARCFDEFMETVRKTSALRSERRLNVLTR